MNKRAFIFLLVIVSTFSSYGQDGEAPNYANSALLPPGSAQDSKFTNAPVNLFTGQPNVSIPIFF